MRRRGFSLIELLVVIAIIGVLTTLSLAYILPAQSRARDAKRKNDLAEIGRFLAGSSCYLPDAGAGDYDLAVIFNELKTKNPQITQMIARPPRDPKGGTDAETGYRYLVSADGQRCALYANLETAGEQVTITTVTAPTPGNGTGVLQAAAKGRNGTDRFFQVSN